MTTKIDLKTEQLEQLCKKFNVKELYLFGSDLPRLMNLLQTVTLILWLSLIVKVLKGLLINLLISKRNLSKSMVDLLTYIIIKNSEIPSSSKK